MTSNATEPKSIPVGQEPPPLRPPSPKRLTGRPADQGHGEKTKGKRGRRKTANRFAVVNGFLDFSAGGLSRAEALTWLMLWRDTKPNGITQTSQADLARRIGTNPSTVKRAVAALVKAGLLIVVYRGSLRRGPSAYRVRPLAREQVTPERLPPGG
jgi:DNA-binding MarR family transcriptional regulator